MLSEKDPLLDVVKRSRETCNSADAVMDRALGFLNNKAGYDSRFDYKNKITYKNEHGPFTVIGVTYHQLLAFIRLYNQVSEDSFYNFMFREKTGFDIKDVVVFGEVENTPELIFKKMARRTSDGYETLNVAREVATYNNAKQAVSTILYILNKPLYIIAAYEPTDNTDKGV